MGYSRWGHKELDTTERLHLSLVPGSGCVWVSQTMMQGGPLRDVHGVIQRREEGGRRQRWPGG